MDKSITHIRPRFKLEIPHPHTKVMERVALLLENPPDNIKGKIIKNHIVLDIVGEDVHYWSPQLNFRIEEDEFKAGQTIMAGLIGPRPPVWTLFMFIYFSVGILGFFISTFSISKLLLGEFTLSLLAFPIAIIFMLTAYAAGKYGERLGKDQIEDLKQFIRDAIAFD